MTADPTIRSHRSRAYLLAAVALVVLLALPVRAYVAEPFAIPSESMAPTLRPGDHVLVEKLSYRFGSPRRGDLVVFRSPDGGALAVKRIVGLAGDRVAIEDGLLAIDGHVQREPYVDQRRSTPSTSARSSCPAATSSSWATIAPTLTIRATTAQCLDGR